MATSSRCVVPSVVRQVCIAVELRRHIMTLHHVDGIQCVDNITVTYMRIVRPERPKWVGTQAAV